MPSEAYMDWENIARAEARRQLPSGFALISNSIQVTASIFYKGQRPDLSGAMESIGDCLEGIVWANDRQIISWDGSRLIKNNDNPRTVVAVKTKGVRYELDGAFTEGHGRYRPFIC